MLLISAFGHSSRAPNSSCTCKGYCRLLEGLTIVRVLLVYLNIPSWITHFYMTSSQNLKNEIFYSISLLGLSILHKIIPPRLFFRIACRGHSTLLIFLTYLITLLPDSPSTDSQVPFALKNPYHLTVSIHLPFSLQLSTILSMAFSSSFGMLFPPARASFAALSVQFPSSLFWITSFLSNSAAKGTSTSLSRDNCYYLSPMRTTTVVFVTDVTRNVPSVTEASFCFLSWGL